MCFHDIHDLQDQVHQKGALLMDQQDIHIHLLPPDHNDAGYRGHTELTGICRYTF